MNRLERGQLSRRERQILEILYRLGQGTAKEVQEDLPDPPSYSAVRALLATLEGKEMVRHSKEGRRYVYKPAITPKRAKRTALNNLLQTFFEGKPENLVASLLDPSDQQLTKKEIDKIRSLIDRK
ncbi:MAG: BlaI/MecI/CopY family transcriptional regulator [Akkermansiaceae bacterium]|nr:BlaI/MecI/CopY family transcriptional regulator [Akkermansiaceae bacterium]NNM28171.1 BlaI/MecI/CopY family transcriptional regulator [Akkermansiaceae bacterium]